MKNQVFTPIILALGLFGITAFFGQAAKAHHIFALPKQMPELGENVTVPR